MKNKPLNRIMSNLVLTLTVAVALTGCSLSQVVSSVRDAALLPSGQEQYETTFYDLFDTVSTIKGYAGSETEFTETVTRMYDELKVYHQLFDIYHTYEGVNNLKTINDNAGRAPVEVDEKLIDLLLLGKEIYEESDGKVNIFMGSVLSIWHEAREAAEADSGKAVVPDPAVLKEAAAHIDPDRVIIDPEKKTVCLEDPAQRIDAGAVGKGYASQQVMEAVPEGYVLNLGGNICVSGPKPDGSDWSIGVQDPDASDNYLKKLGISSGSVVTSGDYQRYFTVEGKRYHHIIDPDTLQPAGKWRSVTIIAEDSAAADFLSTALFLMDQKAGAALLQKYGAEACWIDQSGTISESEGFGKYEK